MTSGEQSYSVRRRFIWSQWAAEIFAGRHMRGLEENIWKVFAPIAWARSAAVKTPPAVERCMPIRFAAGAGGFACSRDILFTMLDLRCFHSIFAKELA